MAATQRSRRSPIPPTDSGRLRRAREIYAIARRHGLLPLRRLDTSKDPATASLRAQQGEHLRQALEEAGGAFIKMGQLLSTQDETLPTEWALALRGLQKDVTPSPWPEVKAALERTFGGPISSVFADFDDVPVAAASVAQVHRATLRHDASGAGQRGAVAVKVLRPGIADALWRDIAVAKQLARLAAALSTRARKAGVIALIDQYAADLLRQTDLDQEARNLTALQAAREASPDPHDVTLPRLYADVSSHDVVVMEFLTAPTLTALLDTSDSPHDNIGRALRTVLGDFLRQVLVDAVFHADLHPGNILIDGDGHPSLVDFGAVGRIDARTRKHLVAFLMAYVQDEPDRITDAFLALVPSQTTPTKTPSAGPSDRFFRPRPGQGSDPTWTRSPAPARSSGRSTSPSRQNSPNSARRSRSSTGPFETPSPPSISPPKRRRWHER